MIVQLPTFQLPESLVAASVLSVTESMASVPCKPDEVKPLEPFSVVPSA